MTHPRCTLLDISGANDLIPFDVRDFWHGSYALYHARREPAGIAVEVALVYMGDTAIVKQRVLVVSRLEEIEMVSSELREHIILEDDDVGVVD